MNVHRSAPISISHDASDNRTLEGVDGSQGNATDAYARLKSLNCSRIRTNSISPGLASPTPPTFIPDGSHQASRVGNYLIVEHVEGHNSGNVFRAVNINTEEESICKVYKCEEYRKAVDGYSRTANHPNINKINDIVFDSNKAYCFLNPGISMQDSGNQSEGENRKGFRAENLHSLVRSKKRLPEVDAAPLFAQVVAAVAHCHQHNIVLRDLKLRKFIFKDTERKKLMLETLDDASILETDNDIMVDRHGCPAYASPEILCFSSSTPPSKEMRCGYSGKASDIWSLGVMLYTLLVGRYPFHESDPKLMFGKISRAQFTFPDSLSHASRDLVHNLLRRKPSERLQADQILSHPWLKRLGNCWDVARPAMSLGSGGDRREVDKIYMLQFGRYNGGVFPTSLYSTPFYEDQVVPDVVPADTSEDMVFEFGD
uniref:Tribbles homolog 2 n=1 Tax=Phallusia mammillata TaxID=59560 RepID=A0A6F9DWI6_9ASCI|nr:tribbles homolog 2 [Phallusia mammillata]